LRKVLPRHRDASAAWHSARACAGSFSPCCARVGLARDVVPSGNCSQGRRKGGAVAYRRPPHCRAACLTSSLPSWPSWPPSSLSSPLFLLKGSCSCLMATPV